MLHSFKEISIKGYEANEDSIGYSSNFIFVIDGASSLQKEKITTKNSDAEYFSHHLCNGLMENLGDTSRDIKTIILSILENIKKDYDKQKENSLASTIIPPSASVSIFRINQNQLEYFGLGDCTAVIKKNSQEVIVLHDDTVAKLDNIVIQQMIKISSEHNISIREARKWVDELLINNRLKMNTPEGYWTVDLSGVGVMFHATTCLFPACDIYNIAVMSDGFADIVNSYGIYGNFEELNNAVETKELNHIVRSLFDLQDSDYDFSKYPRLKFRDDTSIVWAKF